MKTFGNCEMSAGQVSLRLKNGVSTYEIYGFVLTGRDEDGEECIFLQPADLRRSPVLKVKKANVACASVQF